MRRIAFALASVLLAGSVAPVAAQQPAQQPAQPPHAWLYGTWTGGMFPVSGTLPAQTCLSQPVVVFTRDIVMRATITELELTQRVIETVRASPSGVDFRFVGPGGSELLRIPGRQQVGFGCEAVDILHVQRRGENEITFPGCADFPNPLVRCQTR